MAISESGASAKAVPTGFSVGDVAIIQALSPEGFRRLLIPLKDGPGPEDELSAGVKLRNTRIGPANSMADYLEVRCELPRLNDLFDDVAGEMIEAVTAELESPGSACIAVLERWRALLRSVRGQRPSRSSVVGILGELLIAARILKADPERRIDVWVGREGQRHDFRRGGVAIESKATLRTEGRVVAIHGVHQLEEPQGGTLLLAWMRFEHVPGGELSISNMISRISALGVPSDLIHTGLDERGLPPGSWPEEQFELREFESFRVDADFPRIVPNELAAGVRLEAISNLRYDVDLELGADPLPEKEFEMVVKEMATTE